MAVFRSLSNGIDVLQRNPVIVALVFAVSLLSTGTSAVQIVDPLLVYPVMLLFYLLAPFVLAGFVGMIHDGLSRQTSVGRFLEDGKSNYLSVLGGVLVLGVITIVLYVGVAIVGIIAAVFVLGVGSMAGSTSASLVVLAIGGIVAFLVITTPFFILQFFPAAVVIDDLGLADAFSRSGSIVKRNFLSVLGFDAVAFLFYLVVQIPTLYLFYTMYESTNGFQQMQDGAQQTQTMFDLFSTTELGIYLTLSVVLTTIVFSVLQTYYVAYYDQLPR